MNEFHKVPSKFLYLVRFIFIYYNFFSISINNILNINNLKKNWNQKRFKTFRGFADCTLQPAAHDFSA